MNAPKTIAPRVAAVSVISTHLFTLKYNLEPPPASLSPGAKAGIGVGAGVGSLLILAIISFFVIKARRRRRERQAAAVAAAFESGMMSPAVAPSTYAASTFSHQPPPMANPSTIPPRNVTLQEMEATSPWVESKATYSPTTESHIAHSPTYESHIAHSPIFESHAAYSPTGGKF